MLVSNAVIFVSQIASQLLGGDLVIFETETRHGAESVPIVFKVEFVKRDVGHKFRLTS